MKKRINIFFFFFQALWHILYLLTLTIWRNIPTVPYFAAPSEILDETRWFWLVDAPDSMIQNELLILSLFRLAALVEILICFIWLFIYLKKRWRISPVGAKVSYVMVFLMGCVVSAIFEWQMHLNFTDMSEYYYLWQREFRIEVLAIVIAIFALIGFLSFRWSVTMKDAR